MPISKPAASSSRRAAASGLPKSNLKRRPSVSFQVDTQIKGLHDEEAAFEEEMDDEEDENNGDDNVMDMLNILQEYQKKKSNKSSSRSDAIEAKKQAINANCYAQINQMKGEGVAYIEQVKARVDELQEKEVPPDEAFADIAALFGIRSKGVESHLDTLTDLLSRLSPARVEVIEENSTDVHSHKARFEKTRKKVMKKARRDLHSGMEQQKLATDAQAYIKHFKHLVQK